MAQGFIDELRWRGMVQDIMPGTEELLEDETVRAYIGFDPTADSLHIGSLVQIILLMHLQRAGHKPIALVGGATGMIGDPSQKSKERNLLGEEDLKKNIAGIQGVLNRFLTFDKPDSETAAELVNNHDWIKDFSLIDFARDVGKHLTVNYMMAKDSVKKRISSESGEGMSFTEFTYQLIQGYDFYHLYENHGCKLQLGGSDQWGNITTGTELIRRKSGGKAYAVTTPLVTKADGTKFGKTESGNVWLDKDKTSVYKFYQFWLNATDEDAANWIKVFTFLDQQRISELEKDHADAPGRRLLQKTLAEEVTVMVHGREEYEAAVRASQILFGKSTAEELKKLDKPTLEEVFDGVPRAEITRADLGQGIIDFCSDTTGFLKSKAEVRRALKENSLAVNKEKVSKEKTITTDDIIADSLIVMQRGKKRYFIAQLVD